MNRELKNIILVLVCGLFICAACSKETGKTKGIKKIHKEYQNGFISECQLNDVLVYTAGINAYDAGSAIYDIEGELLGTCNYAWGTPDDICSELTDCERVYSVPDNIWGWDELDKYNLGF